MHFSLLMCTKIINYGPVKKFMKPLFILDNIFIRFRTKVYRQTIGIPSGSNCVPLVADLLWYFIMREIS